MKNFETTIRPKIDLTPLVGICLFVILALLLLMCFAEQEARSISSVPSSLPNTKKSGPPLRVRITADEHGAITGLWLGERSVGSLPELQKLVRRNTAGGEIELDCDDRLHYMHLLQAIAAISSDRADGQTIVPLIERVKLVPQK